MLLYFVQHSQCYMLLNGASPFVILSHAFTNTGLQPNPGIQGKLGKFMLHQRKSEAEEVFLKIRENQGSFKLHIVLFQSNDYLILKLKFEWSKVVNVLPNPISV